MKQESGSDRRTTQHNIR